MRLRLAMWVLVAAAVVCAAVGAGYATDVLHAYRVEPSSMGFVIADAMRATVLLVVAGCCVVGLVVLRGVAELLDQVLAAVNHPRPVGRTEEDAPRASQGMA